MKRLISLECNRCGKHICGMYCSGDGIPGLAECKKIKSIKRRSYDPFFMEIICDDCLDKAGKEGEHIL